MVSRIQLMQKQAILKAIAEKLIPGIPIQTRISILQQTSNDGSEEGEVTNSLQNIKLEGNQMSVLEAVIDRATSRSEIQREIDSERSKLPPIHYR